MQPKKHLPWNRKASGGRVYPAAATGVRALPVLAAGLLACSSSGTPLGVPDSSAPGTGADAGPATCAHPGSAAHGPADMHCDGRPAQKTSTAACGIADAGPHDAGAIPTHQGLCGENTGAYGATMYGQSGSDDDCKYHVTWTSTDLCENGGVYFTVKVTYQDTNEPARGAATFAELCLDDYHPAPPIDGEKGLTPGGQQTVVEGPPGTYKVGPVEFDASGKWTVRFHFHEDCLDVVPQSPHGHAAFFVSVP